MSQNKAVRTPLVVSSMRDTRRMEDAKFLLDDGNPRKAGRGDTASRRLA